ncbi:DUF6640 family protein [Nocardia sp. NPDC088792]|uniref:DUF6640 family protein n=1 Tax=Nocardia sp. NPDC088792 TaxID=3364332 RepID=UPI0038015841
MTTISTGKVLLSLSSFWSAYGCYHFDWNETHIYNPQWPPHAKFHNAQTMSTGAVVGAAGLYLLWGRRGAWTRDRLQLTAAAASVYWITQLSAIFYPGTALFDHPQHPSASGAVTAAAGPPKVLGPQTVVASVALAINVLAYGLEIRRLARNPA